MDLDDVRSKFGSLYDRGIDQALFYTVELGDPIDPGFVSLYSMLVPKIIRRSHSLCTPSPEVDGMRAQYRS